MIFYAFRGTPDELRSSGIGHAGEFEYVPFRDMLVGIVHSTRYASRKHIDELHPGLMSLPGILHGNLEQRHVQHLSVEELKEGDTMRSLLSVVYEETGYEPLNPQHH